MTYKNILDIWDPIATAKQAVEASTKQTRKTMSAHKKLAHKQHKIELTEALKPLTGLFQSFLPKSWDMARWAFTPSIDPDEIRWGKRNTGVAITLNKNNLCYIYGLFSEMATQSQLIRYKKDDAKLSKMDLDINAPHTFMFQGVSSSLGRLTSSGTFNSTGVTPVDAYARLLLKGQLFHRFYDCFEETAFSAFKEGQKSARHALKNQGRNWSASLALWDEITQDPVFKALRRGNEVLRLSRTDLRLGSSTFYIEKDLNWLKKSLKSCGEPQKNVPHFVSTGHSPKGYLVNAWNPNSAVVVAQFCHLCLEGLNQKSISKNISHWKVHAAPEALEHSLKNV